MLWQCKMATDVAKPPRISTSSPSQYGSSLSTGLISPSCSSKCTPVECSTGKLSPFQDLTPPPDNNTLPVNHHSVPHKPIEGPLKQNYSIEEKCRYKIPLNKEDFLVVRTLGTGTFARVCLVKPAVETPSNRNEVYALKILRKTEIIRLKQVEHVRNERSILTDVSGHPFITRLFGTFSDFDRLFMLLDYVPGGELFTYLRRYKTFDEPAARFYAAEIALVLEHLHEIQDGIAYRDLKPENILLDAQGHIKLVDFGFAKKLGGRHSGSGGKVPMSLVAMAEREARRENPSLDSALHGMTPEPKIYAPYARETYTLCGTPEYLAPEVIQNKGHTGAVDWWALGILIFEFLTGYPPFWHQNPLEIYRQILEDPIRFPTNPPVSPAAQDIILQLCTANRTQRLGNIAGGASRVKSHEFFKGIDWDRVYRKEYEAPIVPRVRWPGDASCFDVYPEDDGRHGEYTAEMAEKYEEEFADF